MKIWISILLMVSSFASGAPTSWYEKKAGDHFLYELFKEEGVPLPALERTFDYLNINENAELEVSIDNKKVKKSLANKNYAIIVDYSQPSSKRRLYLLNLQNGEVEKYFVAHGVNSGEDLPVRFSNEVDSLQSSLGFYLTGSIYDGKYGEALILHGLEESNSRAFERSIVMHGAPYVSMDFLDQNGRMGRSWGCPAVSQAINQKILPLIKEGALILAYHKDLMTMAQTSPAVQYVGNNQKPTPTDSDEIMPEELHP